MKAFHPAADIFPMIQGADFDAFCADIKANGLHAPIVVHPDGRILDGRNRERACDVSGVKAEYKTWDGKPGAEVAYVLSLNLSRRHLDESQRAMVAARLAALPVGANQHVPNGTSSTQSEAATALNVSKHSVQRARVVLETGSPELVEAVEQGKIAVSQAVKVASRSPETQRRVVEKVQVGTKPTEAMRQVHAETVEARRIEAPSGKYRVIYADPPWSYGNTQPDYHPEQRDHYPVMSIAEVCALPIRGMAEDDAVLFLWVTSPILEEAFDVIRTWGFKYKASFVWDKVKHNMGHYNSVRHELLLVCTRGSCQPDAQKLFDSVVTEERTGHSVKPAVFYNIIETIYNRGAKVELFARSARDGWDRWGYEAPCD